MSQDINSQPSQSTSKTDAAREQAGRVGQEAKADAGEVVQQAKTEAGHVADEAKVQARNLLEDARTQLRHQAVTQSDRAAGGVQQMASSLQALAEGNTDQAGPLVDYANELGRRLDDMGRRMQDLGYDGVVDEVKYFARRRPGVFLLSAAAAGLVVGRLVRGERDRQQPSGVQRSGTYRQAGTDVGTDEVGVLQPAPGGGVVAPSPQNPAPRPAGVNEAGLPAAGAPGDVEHLHDDAITSPDRGVS